MGGDVADGVASALGTTAAVSTAVLGPRISGCVLGGGGTALRGAIVVADPPWVGCDAEVVLADPVATVAPGEAAIGRPAATPLPRHGAGDTGAVAETLAVVAAAAGPFPAPGRGSASRSCDGATGWRPLTTLAGTTVTAPGTLRLT